MEGILVDVEIIILDYFRPNAGEFGRKGALFVNAVSAIIFD
jgi:hypothetical protein